MKASDAIKDDAFVDLYLDSVLRASGTALRHYAMPNVKAAMRDAMRDAMAKVAGIAIDDLMAQIEQNPGPVVAAAIARAKGES